MKDDSLSDTQVWGEIKPEDIDKKVRVIIKEENCYEKEIWNAAIDAIIDLTLKYPEYIKLDEIRKLKK